MKKPFTLFLALIATTALGGQNNVITYTATEKLSKVIGDWDSGLHTNAFNVAITSHDFSNGAGTITFSGEIITIGDQAFFGCSGLTSVTIPNSVTTIGDYAFYNCSGLTSITIPNSVTTIGKYTFYGCSGLTSIEIPNSVTTIGEDAFAYCSGLTSVTIPNSVTSIGENAFYYCLSLPVFDNLLYADTYLVGVVDQTLSTYTIKDGTKWIGEGAFASCSGLTSVTIPNSVTTIGEDAFAYCSGLTSIEIPNSVTTIGGGVFSGCIGIRSITCFAKQVPTAGSHTFYGLSQYTKAYVLASLLEDYQFAIGWRDLNLQPIGATESQLSVIDQVVVSPSSDDVTITWPVSENADTYTLVITKDGEVFCTLTFNANGQLTNIAFAAPSHNGAHQAPVATLTAQGYQFTVSGLNPGTSYNYSVTATDASGQTLAEHKGNFSTTGSGTRLNTLPYEGKDRIESKFIHNGNIIIKRNGCEYSLFGQKINN